MNGCRKMNVGEKISVRYKAREIHRGGICVTVSAPFDGVATIEKTECGYIVEAGNYVRYSCGDNRGLMSWKGALKSYLDSGDTRHDLISAEEV